MTEYLQQKWRQLRMYRTRDTFPIDYKIIHNMAKIMGRASCE